MRGDIVGVLGGVDVEDKMGTAVADTADLALACTSEVPTSVKVEKNHYNDNKEENNNSTKHYLAT